MAAPSFLPAADSIVNSSLSAAAPAANTLLAAFTPGVPGLYSIFCRASTHGGTPTVAEAFNATFKKNGSAYHNLPSPPGAPPAYAELTLYLSPTDSVSVTTGATVGSASVQYMGELIVTRLS